MPNDLNFYTGGYENLPDQTTPIKAEALNFAEVPKVLGGGILDNADFTFNQRQNLPFSGSGYHFDRWTKTTGVVSVASVLSGGARFTSNTSISNCEFAQQKEAPCDYEVGDKFLLSYDVIASSSYNLRVLVQNVTTGLFLESNIQVPISTTQERKNIVITSATPVSKGDIIKVFVHGAQIITSGEWFEINNVQFKNGFVPTPFIPKSYGEEFRECKRYFQKSFRTVVTPQNGSAANDFFDRTNVVGVACNGGTVANQKMNFEVEMRTIPTVTYYGNNTGALLVKDINANTVTWTPLASLTNFVTEKGIIIYQAIVQHKLIVFHYTADAEL